MFKNIKQRAVVLMIVAIICHVFSLTAQNVTSVNDSIIQWVSQFPPDKENKPKVSFAKKVTDFIAGENDELRLIKPMSVIAVNPDTFIVFDQENGLPFYVKNQQLEFIKCTKKRNLYFPSIVNSCYVKNHGFVFTDSKLNKIFFILADQKEVKVLNDSLKLNQPTGIAYSADKEEIWVVETAAHRISVLNLKGELIKQIGKRGTGNGEFNYPTSVWIDREGMTYVIDAMNYRVQIFNKDGKYLSSFGKQGDATGYFARPKGIATDSHHNIYITDALFHTVQIFDKDGKYLYNFGEQGREPGQFWMPSGIFIDKNDYIYVSDTYNSRIQIFKINLSNIK
jgi:DNA-binding beta-propeller fold protein YncE